LSVFKEHLFGRDLDTENNIYVILGDIHFPVVRHLPEATRTSVIRSIPERLTVAYTDHNITVEEWYNYYHVRGGGDISHRSPTINRIGAFIHNLEQWYQDIEGTHRVFLIQLGDMYELWVGLNRLYRDTPEHQADIIFQDDQANPRAVRDWIGKVHAANTWAIADHGTDEPLPIIMHQCQVTRKKFLYGNHDCYFKALGATPFPQVPQRFENHWEHNIFMEHGHRTDEHNREGHDSGHLWTQRALIDANLRSYQGLLRGDGPRNDFIKGAVKKFDQYRRQDRSLKVYVMGHTHNAYARIIRVRRA
jgi:hypothetical protein